MTNLAAVSLSGRLFRNEIGRRLAEDRIPLDEDLFGVAMVTYDTVTIATESVRKVSAAARILGPLGYEFGGTNMGATWFVHHGGL